MYANVYVTIQSHGLSTGAWTHYVTANAWGQERTTIPPTQEWGVLTTCRPFLPVWGMETLHLPVKARRKTRRRQRWVQDPIRSSAAVLYPVPYDLTISRSDGMVHINAYPNPVLFDALHATVSPIEQGFRPAFFLYSHHYLFFVVVKII